jgi:hypothetical protein
MRTLLFCLLAAIPAAAQQYTITTVAGGSPIPTPVPALKISIGVQRGTGGPAVAVDGTSTIYFTSYNCVFKVDASGTATRVAGISRRAFSGDGGPAVSAALNDPRGLALDRNGNLFIADHGNRRIRKIAPNGVISTIAGTGIDGNSGDGGPATSAQIGYVEKLAVDSRQPLLRRLGLRRAESSRAKDFSGRKDLDRRWHRSCRLLRRWRPRDGGAIVVARRRRRGSRGKSLRRGLTESSRTEGFGQRHDHYGRRRGNPRLGWRPRTDREPAT